MNNDNKLGERPFSWVAAAIVTGHGTIAFATIVFLALIPAAGIMASFKELGSSLPWDMRQLLNASIYMHYPIPVAIGLAILLVLDAWAWNCLIGFKTPRWAGIYAISVSIILCAVFLWYIVLTSHALTVLNEMRS